MTRMMQAIAAGGILAGALDIIYAFVVFGLTYGLTPMAVLHSVASGWIGRDAATGGGWRTAALGLATHFAITAIMAAVFVLAASRMKALTDHALIAGVLYGMILYVVMNYVVVPLSAAHASQHFAASAGEAIERLQTAFSALRPTDPLLLAGTILTHTALVGIPIALAAKWFLER